MSLGRTATASGPGLASIRGAEEDPGPEAAGILAEGHMVQWLVTIGMRILNPLGAYYSSWFLGGLSLRE